MFLFHFSSSTADGDGRPIPALQFHLNVLELVCALQEFLESVKVRMISEDICREAGIEQLVQLFVP